jgi:hypothetical protein
MTCVPLSTCRRSSQSRRVVTRSELRHQRRRLALMTVSAIVGLILVVGGSYYVASGNEQIVRLTARGAM